MPSGGGNDTQTVVQENNPPDYLQPFLVDLANRAQTASFQVPTDPFQGPLVARPNELQGQSLVDLQGVGQDFAQQGAGQTVTDLANFQAGQVTGDAFTPPSFVDLADPQGIQQAIQSASAPIIQQVQEQVIPQLQSQSVLSGAYTGAAAQNTLPGQIMRDLNQALINTAGQITFQDVADQRAILPQLGLLEQQATAQVPGLFQQGFGLETLAPNLGFDIGSTIQGFDQSLINEALANYNNAVSAPFNGLQQLAALLQPGLGFGTSTQESTQDPGAGGVLGGLQGAAGAIGLGSSLGLTGLATLGPIGAAGALLGAIF